MASEYFTEPEIEITTENTANILSESPASIDKIHIYINPAEIYSVQPAAEKLGFNADKSG